MKATIAPIIEDKSYIWLYIKYKILKMEPKYKFTIIEEEK